MTVAPALEVAQIEARPGDRARIGELLSGAGCAVIRGAIDLTSLGRLSEAIDGQYAALEAAVATMGIHEALQVLPVEMRYQASAAALGLDGFAGWEAATRALDGGVAVAIQSWFRGRAALVRDLTWVRRQYPLAMRATGQAGHVLHQDGAYGFAFENGAGGDRGEVLNMLTAWMPLCPAGRDAPGLEFRMDSPKRVLGLAELAEAAREACGVTPAFDPGDVVLMAGHHVHRTHVTEAMTRARTAVELRFVSMDDADERIPGPRMGLGEMRGR